jgi:trimeric autotransporter adhesin
MTTQSITNSIKRSPVWRCVFLIPSVLVCFALLPKAQAVSPAPDGGYPGENTAEGQTALLGLTTGRFNTAVGYLSLLSDGSGSYNTAIGAGTLLANTADENTATGAGALLSNTAGFGNTANGAFALFNNTTGAGNTACGEHALYNNTSGGNNIALGQLAGSNVTTTINNIDIGNSGVASESNTIRIGTSGIHTFTFISGIHGTHTMIGDAIPVLIDSNNQLGTTSSSRRFKKEIKPMDTTSEGVLALKPVTFQYKSDKTNTPQFGLIAEDVAAVNSDLIVRDSDGKPYTVRYDAVNAMLLNEFLKEHRKVEEQERKVQGQEATITQLKCTVAQQQQDFQAAAAHQQAQIEALTAGLRRVSARLATASSSSGGLELSKATPQTVLNNQ